MERTEERGSVWKGGSACAWARERAQRRRYEAVLEMQPSTYSIVWIIWCTITCGRRRGFRRREEQTSAGGAGGGGSGWGRGGRGGGEGDVVVGMVVVVVAAAQE